LLILEHGSDIAVNLNESDKQTVSHVGSCSTNKPTSPWIVSWHQGDRGQTQQQHWSHGVLVKPP